MRKQRGFTLIEIAIVLVIIGLLLGGVLKGQELITAARVRNIASQMDGVKIAYLGFQDRFRVLPGDYENSLAAANIGGPTATLGCTLANATCQDGKINDTGGDTESILAWHQLSRAGFITGSYNGLLAVPSPLNNPTNPFSGFLQIIYDVNYSDALAAPPAKFNIKTGGNVPSSVLAELDRKVDDGNALTGAFRNAPNYDGATATCLTAANVYNAAADIKSCGGVAIQ